jgi:hypothetical protein
MHSECGDFDQVVAGRLLLYRRAALGDAGGADTTTVMGNDSEPQPDQHLQIHESKGGRTRIADGWVVGLPEMIVELGWSSRDLDLGPKKADYECLGVLEYVFLDVGRWQVCWFVLREGRYLELAPGDDGVFRSEVFPGLWLDGKALFQEDFDAMLHTLNSALASPEHATFVARLADA